MQNELRMRLQQLKQIWFLYVKPPRVFFIVKIVVVPGGTSAKIDSLVTRCFTACTLSPDDKCRSLEPLITTSRSIRYRMSAHTNRNI